MRNSSHKRLVILSVPFLRLIRVLLSEQVIGTLRPHYDVLIISPFAENQVFQSEYGANGTRFLEWKAAEKLRQPVRSLLAISSLLRMQGYYRRFKNQGMDYFNANKYLIFGDDGNDERITLSRRIICFVIISIGGMWTGAWRLFDRLIGPSLFNFPKLREVVQDYEQVTLIQSASWGIQDQMLAWMGRQQKWRKVMIPYTADQLFANGYLYSDFDAICVQGPFERWCADHLHNIPDNRIVPIGSTWFRHIDEIKQRVGHSQPSCGVSRRRKILYAGSARLYFPIASEYLGLETLLSAIETGKLTDVDLVYRPFGESAEIRGEIQQRYENIPNLQIQFAQQACYGLEEYGGGSQRKELEEYIAQLREVNLVVMCGATTLALDAAYLGIPSIANLSDPSGTLSRRHTHLMFNREGRFYNFESIPVIQALDQLVPCIKELLNDKEKAASIAHQTASQWDFPETDFSQTLLETLNPKQSGHLLSGDAKKIMKSKHLVIKQFLAAGIFRTIRLVAWLPFAYFLLFMLPRTKIINLNEPHNYSWLVKNINNYKVLLFTYIARYSRHSSPILANAHFRRGGGGWCMVLNLNEYGQCAFYFGNVSLPLLRLISNGTTNETFLDIGANVGIYSLAASELFGKVIAFEPDPRSLSALQKNIALSKALNVTVAPIALSDKIGTAELMIDPLNQGGSSLNAPGGSYSLKDEERNLSRKKSDSISASFSVQSERLDDYLAKWEAQNIRLVKIDVEGHEESILSGATDMLQREKPILFVEVSTWDRVKKMLALLPPAYSAYEPYTGTLLDDTTQSGMNYSDVIFSTAPPLIK